MALAPGRIGRFCLFTTRRWRMDFRRELHAHRERSSASVGVAMGPYYETVGRQNLSTRARSSEVVNDLQLRFRNASSYRDQFYVTYHDMEEAVKRRGYSLYRLGAVTFLAISSLATLYWGNIKRWGAQEGAEVASQTLGDERLVMKAEVLALNIANALLTDAATSVAAKDFFSEIAADTKSLNDAKTFALDVCKGLVEDKELMAKTSTFFAEVIRTEPVWESAKELGSWVVAQPEFQAEGFKTIRSVFYSDDFKRLGYDFLSEAFVRTLSEEKTTAESLKLSTTVLNDPKLRQVAGDAIWAATKSGILGLRVSGKDRQPEKTSLQVSEATP